MSIAKTLNIPLDFVRVQCPYTGGGFGSKGSSWSHIPLCRHGRQTHRQAGQASCSTASQMFGPVGAASLTTDQQDQTRRNR